MTEMAEASTKIEPPGAVFEALRKAGVKPEVAYRADHEVRHWSGKNVIAAIGARIEAAENRIGDLRVVLLRVIWPLIILLAVPIFGELCRTLGAPVSQPPNVRAPIPRQGGGKAPRGGTTSPPSCGAAAFLPPIS